jgi:hypothetical protein
MAIAPGPEPSSTGKALCDIRNRSIVLIARLGGIPQDSDAALSLSEPWLADELA